MTTTVRPTEKTPGPHGITLEMRAIPRRTFEVVHEHTVGQNTLSRFKKFGSVPNRATRRAYARGRGVAVPRPTMLPYEKPTRW